MHRVQVFTRAVGVAAAITVASTVGFAQTPAQQPAGKSAATTPAQQVSSDDTTFAQQAAEAGKMEVEQGKMAASKSKNAQVKALANHLVRDHTTANNQLMAIARRKHLDLPAGQPTGKRGSVGAHGDATADTKTGSGRPTTTGSETGTTGASGRVQTTGTARDQSGHEQPWMSETGAAFDKGFVAAQVQAHQDAITLFEKESSSGSDAELKAFASKQLPALRNHLKQAQDLQSKLGTN